MSRKICIDGESLTVADVVSVARHYSPVEIRPEAVKRAQRSRDTVERAVQDGETIYGVNTGFGKLSGVRIGGDQLRELQRNLIRSHAAGVGDPLPAEVVRGIMLLRANVLLKETSGVRPVLAGRLVDLLNAGIHPLVPEHGSVGASGDLAPLSHVGLALMGEGEVDVTSDGPLVRRTVGRAFRRTTAARALEEAGIEFIEFEPKEGLSFINGTQAQSAILALIVNDAHMLWRNAVAATAASLEALRGTPDAFDERIHLARPHPGQIEAARVLRGLLEGSEIRESHRYDDPRVQDAYSLRCAPQIMGPVLDAIEFARKVVEVELNAATDNPLVFGQTILSGGNFHGQPVAMALDFLAIALTTLAGVSERRIECLVNPDLSQGLPAFLTPNAGVQSGLMMVQVTAAGLVAECRSLSTPASVQSIPTDANQEDFVPMGMAAAMKTKRILANAQSVVAVELLCGVQALDFLKPLTPGRGVQKVYSRVREVVRRLEEDRPLTPDIQSVASLITSEALI